MNKYRLVFRYGVQKILITKKMVDVKSFLTESFPKIDDEISDYITSKINSERL